jgi:CheY-like chemotaxis protein
VILSHFFVSFTFYCTVSKSIVDLHGGFLFVSSDGIPGRGCVFTILLRKDRLSLDLPLFTPSTSLVATVPQQDIDDLEANLKFSSQEKEPPPEGFSKTNRIFPIEESPKSLKSLHESDGFTRSVPCVQPPDVAGLTSIAAKPFPRVALCVDDSSMSRKLIGKYLEHHFEVLYAVDGLNAVEVVKNSLTEGHSTIDIIFMDNFMPLLDGLKATHQIRELGFRGPIVGITGNCEPDQIDDFIEQGATTVIEKPIQLNFFRKVILGKEDILRTLCLTLLL